MNPGGAKMDPPEAQEGSREMHKGRGELNTVLGPILGPKMDPKGTQNGAKMGPEREPNWSFFLCTNLEHDLGHSEDSNWKQIEVAEGGQTGRNNNMHGDENSEKTSGKTTFLAKRKVAAAIKHAAQNCKNAQWENNKKRDAKRLHQEVFLAPIWTPKRKQNVGTKKKQKWSSKMDPKNEGRTM